MKKSLIMAIAAIAFGFTSCNEKLDDGNATPETGIVVGFENVDSKLMAGPTSYGENLYNQSKDEAYVNLPIYHDQATDLVFNTTTDGYYFASGGIAVSNWNDKNTAGYTNQCSVYYGENGKGKAGNAGSDNFAVVYASTFGEGAYMYFKTDGVEKSFKSVYVMNSTYAYLSMTNGDGFARKHTYEGKDWLKLEFVGLDAEGEETGRTEVYLSDFRTEDAPGIMSEWTKVDLAPLGKVHKITFKMSGSDGSGMWLNTPAYFCFDDLELAE